MNVVVKKCRSDRRTLGGFTLIELLVVIAIISLLVSILLPSLNRAKAMARTVVCLSNVKQMGLMCMFYADANNDAMPVAKAVYTNSPTTAVKYSDGKTQDDWQYHWFQLLSEFGGTPVEMVNDGSCYKYAAIFRSCTEFKQTVDWYPGYGMIIELFDESGSALPTLMTYNRIDEGQTDTVPHKFTKRSELKVPSSMIWLGPSTDWHIYGDPSQAVPLDTSKTPPLFLYWSTVGSPQCVNPDRHGDVANFLYADGHAATVSDKKSGAGACFYSKVQ